MSEIVGQMVRGRSNWAVASTDDEPGWRCRVTDVTERTTTMVLACLLTDDELREAGATTSRRSCRTSPAKTTAQRGHQGADEGAPHGAGRPSQTMLAIMVSRREQHRDVEVTIAVDYKLGVEIRTRTDTGEVISTRALRDDERQPRLPDGDDA